MSKHDKTLYWSELATDDPKRAAAFYEKVIGWAVREWPMGAPTAEPYRVCMNGETPVCGIMKRTPEMRADQEMWVTYFGVADVDAAAKAVAKSGGKVLRDPFDVPTVGRIAMIADPIGAVVGLITPAED